MEDFPIVNTELMLSFWKELRMGILAKMHKTTYQHDHVREWTKRIIPIVREACENVLHLNERQIWNEYLTLDLCAGTWASPPAEPRAKHDWQIRFAFEHENDDWHEELTKLAHVVADLRVLMSYHNYGSRKSVMERIQEAITPTVIKTLRRVLEAKWLFIMGPSYHRRDWDRPFALFTLDDDFQVQPIPLPDDLLLRPNDLPD
jgi:hypothetical protein